MTERTFSIIKPDATRRNLTGAINAVIEDAGLRIVAQRRIKMTREQAEKFYEIHKERPFFGELAAGGDEISLPKTARIASVDQEHPATPVSVLETILEADEERHTLLGRLETAEPEEMGEIWTRLIEIAQFFTDDQIVG